MPVPFRFVHFLGGLGTASTSGMGVAGWQAWEEYNPTGDRLLRRGGYFYGPIKFEANVFDVSGKGRDESSSKFFSKTHECFNKFFGAMEFNFDIDKTKESVSITIDNPSSGRGSDHRGCTIMQLSHGPQNQGFVFMSETTVKNDKAGMVVWAGAKNVRFANDDTSHDVSGAAFFRYYVLFLEQAQSNWSIKGGIVWEDFNVGSSFAPATNIKIISPDNSINQSYSAKTDSTREQPSSGGWTYQRYSGVWSSSDDESAGSVIFEEVKVMSVYENNEYPDILGVSGELDTSNRGYACTDQAYSTAGRKWAKTALSDFKENLKAWYKPFKDKRGKWENLEDYCLKKSGARNIVDPSEIQFLKDFCYRQK